MAMRNFIIGKDISLFRRTKALESEIDSFFDKLSQSGLLMDRGGERAQEPGRDHSDPIGALRVSTAFAPPAAVRVGGTRSCPGLTFAPRTASRRAARTAGAQSSEARQGSLLTRAHVLATTV